MSDSNFRDHAEAALRESEAKFQTLLETASVGIVLVDEHGCIVLVNGKAEEMFRYPRAELIGQAVEVLLPERYQRGHVSHRADYMNDPGVRSMGHGRDLMARRKDGSEFPVEIGLSYIRTSDGLLTMSFITEISERKQAEEALRRYAQRLESMREIDRAILSAELPEEIAGGALARLQRATPCLHASVMLFDFEAGEALVIASAGRASSGPRAGECLALESFGSFEALRRGEYVLGEGPGRVDRALAYLKMPLCVQEELIGLLYLASDREEDFSEEQIEIAREVANHLAVALQQAQLRGDLEQHAQDLERRVVERTHEIERRREVAEGLRDMLGILNSNRPLEEILDYIVALTSRLLGTDASAIYHLPEQEEILTIVAARGLSLEYVSTMHIAIGQGAVGQAVHERRPVAVSNLRRFLEEQGLLHGESGAVELLRYLSERFEALLAVPLVVKEEVYGSIVLYYAKARHFSEEEIGLAVAFGDQAALAIENARLRAQVEQSAVTAERNRLARDLHDAVTQTLFSTSLIAEVLPRLWERNPAEGVRRLEELRQLTRGALAEMRTLLFELRPGVLIRTELGELLRQLAAATTGRARLPVTVEVEGSGILPPEVQVGLYRIAQEALNNVAKHSNATEAVVDLRFAPEGVTLHIRDNGRGFDLEKIAPERLGLDIMRERTAAMGTTLEIKSQPGQGTAIFVTWRNNTKEEVQ